LPPYLHLAKKDMTRLLTSVGRRRSRTAIMIAYPGIESAGCKNGRRYPEARSS
jgi:hypothetical protein